ncbi:SpoIID/LytB domain protein [Gloeothece citriformis PCC 7424]|uniref:SpoIID/LytB domain protein n=1 Tax=Gloeothece citriformis (strain PCC 7424) TaxID=65393 RepID=B7K715_GLOC7|nr:SpoIID/LytB domain protein [Gloeothece citriformis PCC 7424]
MTTKTRIGRKTAFWMGLTCSFLLIFTPSAKAKDVEIKVGIVQRFGEEVTDKVSIASNSGDSLTLRFVDQNGQPQTLQTNQLTLEIVKQPLSNPVLEERLVLSDHATFETAEDSAKQWEALGIEVEVTQPERWQVWAKRDVYQTPLLRRWLHQSLKAKGYKDPYLETALVSQKPQASFTINGVRYGLNKLDITTGTNQVRVTKPGQQPRLYGGSLRLQPNSYGTYTLVNQVPLETYLRGVVPHEIGPGAPQSATKAQTIIARTYALRNLRRFEADNYELCADTHCQVYYGLTGTIARVDQAIAETKGLVLTYQNELVDALYSSTTGGITAPFSDVWNGEERPYLRAVIDSPNQVWDLSQQSLADEAAFRKFISLKDGFNETGRNVFRWNKQSSLEQLNADLKKYLTRRKHPLADFNTIQAMGVTKRSPSGRVLTLTVQTDKGIIELHKNEARSAFGPPRSTLFYVEPVYNANKQLLGYAFVGGGFGHGVGLSQYGSYNLANLGWSAEKILEFYYPGTVIQPLNESIVFWRE